MDSPKFPLTFALILALSAAPFAFAGDGGWVEATNRAGHYGVGGGSAGETDSAPAPATPPSTAGRSNEFRLGSQSPFANIHHGNAPGFQHNSTETHITPQDGRWNVTMPGGWITGGGDRRGHCRWVSGGWVVQQQQVYVPGYWTQRYVPPVYEPRLVNGISMQIMTQPGRYEPVYVPGYYETRPVRTWMPGRYICPPGCTRH